MCWKASARKGDPLRYAPLVVLTVAALFLAAVPRAHAADRLCISVYRYGAAASDWVRGQPATGTTHPIPAGSYNSIARHIALANTVWAQAEIEWVWEDGVIEDIPDKFGDLKGDVEAPPMSSPVTTADGSLRDVGDRVHSIGSSKDLNAISLYTLDAECYPVVFIRSFTLAGLTAPLGPVEVPAFGGADGGPSTLGRFSLVATLAFPRAEVPAPTTWRQESLISTLSHEFGHSLCLDLKAWHDPAAGGLPALGGIGAWSKKSKDHGHAPYVATPPVLAGPRDPYGFAFSAGTLPFTSIAALVLPAHNGSPLLVPVAGGHGDKDTIPAAGPRNALRQNVMWYTGEQRGPDGVQETLLDRQKAVSQYCAPLLRDRFSPSISVSAGGPSVGLAENEILWAPALPADEVPPPVALGLTVELDALSYGGSLGAGVYAYKFSVDTDSLGVIGSAVWVEATAPNEASGDEFGGPAAKGNVQIFEEVQLGLAIGDDLDALAHQSPAHVDNKDIDADDQKDRDGVLDPNKTVYFSVGPGGALDPGIVYQVTGAPAGGAGAPAVYASLADLGLQAGDDIDALCVKEGFEEDDFDPVFDKIFFSLTRDSPSVLSPVSPADSADVLGVNSQGNEPQLIIVTQAEDFGLRGNNADELNALKCFEILDVPTASRWGWFLIAALISLSTVAWMRRDQREPTSR